MFDRYSDTRCLHAQFQVVHDKMGVFYYFYTFFRVRCLSRSFELYQCYIQQISKNIIDDLDKSEGKS